jgi:serine/threonine protein kinase
MSDHPGPDHPGQQQPGQEQSSPLSVGPADAPDRYELVAPRSSGGEGEIWSATEQQANFSFRYAIKMIHAEHMADADSWLEQLRLQVALLTQIEHPALVKVREVFVGAPPHAPGEPPAGPPRLYLVMKWIEGRSLQQALESGVVVGRAVLEPLEKIAEAVDYLHSGRDTGGQPVLHRDIKPANILLADDGRVYLVDFGLVRLAGGATRSQVSGTVPFMAPESLHRGEYSPATDRYAVGASVYYALTGEAPVPGDIDGMTQRLTTTLGATETRLVQGILTMLAVSPSHRPLSAAAWVRALRSPVAGTTLGAPLAPPATTPPVPPPPTSIPPVGLSAPPPTSMGAPAAYATLPPTGARPAPPPLPPPFGPPLPFPGAAPKKKWTGLKVVAIITGVVVLLCGGCIGLGQLLPDSGDGSNQGSGGANGTPTPTVSIDRGDPPPLASKLEPVLVTPKEIAAASGLPASYLDASSSDTREGLLMYGLTALKPCGKAVSGAAIGSQTSNGYSGYSLDSDHMVYASSSVAGFYGGAATDYFRAAKQELQRCGWQSFEMSKLGEQSVAYAKDPGDDIYAPDIVVLVRSGQVVFELVERSDLGDEQSATLEMATAMAKHLPKAAT